MAVVTHKAHPPSPSWEIPGLPVVYQVLCVGNPSGHSKWDPGYANQSLAPDFGTATILSAPATCEKRTELVARLGEPGQSTT